MSETPQIKVAESEPSDDDPWQGETLGRKICADKLTAVIQGQIAPMTISVNGEWGSGKTFMLKRWQKQLKKDGYTAIYFNAWEDDFLADPLVAILGQLQSVLISKLGEQVKKELSVGYKLVRNGVLRFVTAGCVDPADLEPERNLLDDYADGIASRAELKESLEKLIAKLPQDKMPLVFIVDELDRCRPTFAIEVLERIKHLFNIDHMVFVLGIDRENLGKSIKSVYGDIDVENYLHRFIDFDFLLPPADHKIFTGAMWVRYHIPDILTGLANTSATSGVIITQSNEFKEVVVFLFTLHQFTLREIEQSIKLFSLLLKTVPANHNIFPLLIPILMVLKLKNPALYSQYVNSVCSVSAVMEYLCPSRLASSEDFKTLIPAVVLSTVSKHDPWWDCIEKIQTLHSNEDVDIGELKSIEFFKAFSGSDIADFTRRTKALSTAYNSSAVRWVHELLNLFSFKPSL